MGLVYSHFDQNVFPRNPTGFSVDRIPNLDGKVAIVTGANTGIGKQTVKALLQKGARVYLGSRDTARGEAAIDDLKKETGQSAILLQLDLADLASVKRAAEEILKNEKSLHILINNGGVMTPPIAKLSADGYDLQFGTNVLGHFYFTKLLTPLLLRTAEETGPVRVVNLASIAHNLIDTINWDYLGDTPERKKASPSSLYFHSKFGNVVYSYELARRYGSKGIISTAVHPGMIASDMYKAYSKALAYITTLMAHHVEKGALTPLYCATAEKTANANGKYFIPWAREGQSSAKTHSEELGAELWNWLEKQVEGK